MSDFSRILRDARERAGLSQAALARAIGVSGATIASWESERRRPNWQARSRVIELADLLGVPASDLNAMLRSAGLAEVPAGRFIPLLDRRKPLAALRDECRSYPWPTLAMNEDFEVVAWNDAANDLAELDFATTLAEPGARHLLRMALSPHFVNKMQRWDEVIAIMVGMWKSTGNDPLSLEGRTPYFDNLMHYVVEKHAAELGRLLEIWQTAPPRAEGRHDAFTVPWLTSQGVQLLFNCELTSWSDFDGVAAFDWHPANAATWRWLEARRAERRAARKDAPAAGTQPAPATARELLRYARERHGLTQRELARRAGLSEELVHSLEAGRKPFTEPALLKLGEALVLNTADLNLLLEAAGFEPRPSEQLAYILGFDVSANARYGDSRPNRATWTPDEVGREIETYSWPALVVNERCEVIAANSPAVLVLGDGITQLAPGPARNLFAVVTDDPFRRGARNWESVVANVLPGNLEAYMAPPGTNPAAAKDGAYFASVVEFVRQREVRAGRGDGVIHRAFAAWRARPGRRLAARVAFDMAWADPAGQLLFDVVIAPWNALCDPYWSIELHPGNARTWEVLEAGRSPGASEISLLTEGGEGEG